MKDKKILKLIIAGLFSAIAVALSGFYIPLGIAKAFPIQHAINIVLGVLLGPWYAMGAAFVTSTIRVVIGTGSLLAYPGSIVGAVLGGLLYQKYNHLSMAFIGEIVGTGLLGGLLAFPIATYFLGKEAAFFAFVVPFSTSAVVGACMSTVVLLALNRAGLLNKMKLSIREEH